MKQDVFRLRSRKDIEHLFRRGRKKESALFRLVALPNALGHLRLALVAPRTTDKRAVVRNRMRRRAREWVRKEAGILQLPADVAIVFRKQACSAPKKIFYEELVHAFRGLRRYSVGSSV